MNHRVAWSVTVARGRPSTLKPASSLVGAWQQPASSSPVCLQCKCVFFFLLSLGLSALLSLLSRLAIWPPSLARPPPSATQLHMLAACSSSSATGTAYRMYTNSIVL
eukprot:COSAG06_NODE_5071_length_3747_cov_1.250000_4_plen_107_part_00